MHKVLVGLVAAAGMMVSQASAALFDGGIVIEGGGTPQVFDIGGGDYLGLVGLNFAELNDEVDLASVQALVTSGSVSNIVAGPNSDNFVGDPAEFSPITSLFVDVLDNADGRVFDALWVVFDAASEVVFSNGKGGSATLANRVTLDGNPLAADPVPLPGAAVLFLGGLAAAGALRHRKTSAAA